MSIESIEVYSMIKEIFTFSVKFPEEENKVYFGCDGEYHINMIPSVTCSRNGQKCPELHTWEQERKNTIENWIKAGNTDCFDRIRNVERDIFPAPRCNSTTKPKKSCDGEQDFWKLKRFSAGCIVRGTNEMLHVSPKCSDDMKNFQFGVSKDDFWRDFGGWTEEEENFEAEYFWKSQFQRPSKPECVVINMVRTRKKDNITVPYDYERYEAKYCKFNDN